MALDLDVVTESQRGEWTRVFFARWQGGSVVCELRWRVQQKELFSISDDAELSLMQTMVHPSEKSGGSLCSQWPHVPTIPQQ